MNGSRDPFLQISIYTLTIRAACISRDSFLLQQQQGSDAKPLPCLALHVLKRLIRCDKCNAVRNIQAYVQIQHTWVGDTPDKQKTGTGSEIEISLAFEGLDIAV